MWTIAWIIQIFAAYFNNEEKSLIDYSLIGNDKHSSLGMKILRK